MNYSLQMKKTNMIGLLPVAQPGKPMQPSAHSATSRVKWVVVPFWRHLYYILPYFPICHKAKRPRKQPKQGKSRKNAWKIRCRLPPHSRSAGAKTPESPKNPLQLGCSVTQIRHFFKRTFFNLPLIFENNVKKATVWLHEREEIYRFRKASPFGRGVTVGDGEGEPVAIEPHT